MVMRKKIGAGLYRREGGREGGRMEGRNREEKGEGEEGKERS